MRRGKRARSWLAAEAKDARAAADAASEPLAASQSPAAEAELEVNQFPNHVATDIVKRADA
jgi:hypothetical protein